MVIAVAGLLSNDNLQQLQDNQYEYILGAGIKNEKDKLKRQVLSLSLKNGQSAELIKDKNTELIISFSESIAKKDAANGRSDL